MALNKRNVFNAAVVSLVAGIELAVVLYAPQYPLECAIVGTCVGTFATILRLPVSGHPVDPAGGGQ